MPDKPSDREIAYRIGCLNMLETLRVLIHNKGSVASIRSTIADLQQYVDADIPPGVYQTDEVWLQNIARKLEEK